MYNNETYTNYIQEIQKYENGIRDLYKDEKYAILDEDGKLNTFLLKSQLNHHHFLALFPYCLGLGWILQDDILSYF